MGLLALCGLLLAMPETVQRGAVTFSARRRTARFIFVMFRSPIFLTGAATLSLSYIPMMGWVGVAGDLNRCRRDEYFAIRAGASARIRHLVIVANMESLCALVKGQPTARFIWRRTNPVKRAGDITPR